MYVLTGQRSTTNWNKWNKNNKNKIKIINKKINKTIKYLIILLNDGGDDPRKRGRVAPPNF